MAKYYTNPITILLKTDEGKGEFMIPNSESKSPNWYFTDLPVKGDIVEIDKYYYEVLDRLFQPIKNRNYNENPRHRPTMIIVKRIGRFDKVNIFASSRG